MGLWYKQQKGFLMADLLVAIAVISITMLAIGGLYIQSTKATTSADSYNKVAMLGQACLERVKERQALSTSALVTTSTDLTTAKVYNAASTPSIAEIYNADTTLLAKDYPGITPVITVSNPADTTIQSKLAEVAVTLTWTDNGTRSAKFTTYVKKYAN